MIIPTDWRLVCLEHPSLHSPELLVADDGNVKLEAGWTGVERGWIGESTTLYGKLIASNLTTLSGVSSEDVHADIPASPNYITEGVSLGDPLAGDTRPTVKFTGGGNIIQTLSGGTYTAQLKEGNLAATIENYKGNPGVDYVAYGRWYFMVMTLEQAEEWEDGIHVRASLYSGPDTGPIVE